tara:strand:- start:183 stop:434 length:252 start_codon:yes stop_codon:yes gene_type:complete
MKITKSLIKELILEELGASEEAEPEKMESDVATLLKLVPKINNANEYQQLVTAVIKHAAEIPRGKALLAQLYKELPAAIKGMK